MTRIGETSAALKRALKHLEDPKTHHLAALWAFSAVIFLCTDPSTAEKVSPLLAELAANAPERLRDFAKRMGLL